MSVVFLILKIIGITLLCLLALVLLLLLVVLFMPISIDAAGFKDKEKVKINGSISVLFKLICANLSLDGAEFDFNLKYPFSDIPKKEKVKKLKKKTKKRASEKKEPVKEKTPEATAPKASEYKPELDKRVLIENEPKPNKKEKKKKVKEAKKKSKLKEIIEKIRFIINFPDKGEILKALVKLIVGIFKAFKTKKFSLDCTYGFDEPDKTGKVLGIISVARPLIQKDINIYPCFEGEFLEFDFVIKGKTCILSLLIPIVCFILTKPIWRLIRTKGGKTQ